VEIEQIEAGVRGVARSGYYITVEGTPVVGPFPTEASAQECLRPADLWRLMSARAFAVKHQPSSQAR
jgi:hypothetical protein